MFFLEKNYFDKKYDDIRAFDGTIMQGVASQRKIYCMSADSMLSYHRTTSSIGHYLITCTALIQRDYQIKRYRYLS